MLQIVFKRMTLFRTLGTIVLSNLATLVLCHLFEPIREVLPFQYSGGGPLSETSAELATGTHQYSRTVTKISRPGMGTRLTPIQEGEILLVRKGDEKIDAADPKWKYVSQLDVGYRLK